MHGDISPIIEPLHRQSLLGARLCITIIHMILNPHHCQGRGAVSVFIPFVQRRRLRLGEERLATSVRGSSASVQISRG